MSSPQSGLDTRDIAARMWLDPESPRFVTRIRIVVRRVPERNQGSHTGSACPVYSCLNCSAVVRPRAVDFPLSNAPATIPRSVPMWHRPPESTRPNSDDHAACASLPTSQQLWQTLRNRKGRHRHRGG
jgi:hypothetical protein